MNKCVLCEETVDEEYGKLSGTFLRAKNVEGVNDLICVCSLCQKGSNWIEEAMIKGA